ncbi:hypothetical protein [Sphingobium sp. WCS2017Hpa-17]|uniref:hypothetical protein n=1 Tax=Sphingobium sp. WCS2017Hpa-17 TaxID=3073638 RepID=UPI00288A897E|nr:hypothetical protein [Sphingobium sp. WCS2017Hpa-17]
MLLAAGTGFTLYRSLEPAFWSIRNFCGIQSGAMGVIAMVISLALNMLLIASVASMFINGRARDRT